MTRPVCLWGTAPQGWQGWPCACASPAEPRTLPLPPQILLLDLSSGAVLWSQVLPGLPGDPQSASLPTADHRSAFFFWGLHELMGTNQMVRAGQVLGARPPGASRVQRTGLGPALRRQELAGDCDPASPDKQQLCESGRDAAAERPQGKPGLGSALGRMRGTWE